MLPRRLARASNALSSPSPWVCPSCTRASLLLHHRRQPQPQQTRTLLTVPPLAYDTTFKKEGIPGLLSPTGYRISWTEYQARLVQKLNDLLAGEPDENAAPKALALKYARDPLSASLFNHASMAHNNQFFFDGFASAAQPLHKCPRLRDALEASFGSVDALRHTMTDTADAMFGPGFVWLVWMRDPASTASGSADRGAFRVLTTYIAGTPYPEAGYRQQGLDMASNNAASHAAYQSSQTTNTLGSFGAMSKHGQHSAKFPPGGTQVVPLLCVNTWEHVYLYDYGLDGKRRYINDWWDAVDWHRVESNLPPESRVARFEAGRY